MSDKLKAGGGSMTEVLEVEAGKSGDMSGLADSLFEEDGAGEAKPDGESAPEEKPDGEESDADGGGEPEVKPEVKPDSNLPPEDLGGDEPEDEEPDAKVQERIEKDHPEPEGLVESAGKAFKTIRQKLVEAETRLAKASTTANTEEVLALKARLAKYETSRSDKEIIAEPAFQEAHIKPYKETVATISEIGKRYDIRSEVLEQARRERNPRDRADLLEGERISQSALAQLLPLYNSLDSQNAKIRQAIESEKSKLVQSSETLTKQRQDQATAAVEAEITKLQSEGHFLLKDSKKAPGWLPGIKTAAAKLAAASGLPVAAVARQAVLAQVADHYKAMYVTKTQALAARVAELEKQLGLKAKHTGKMGAGRESSQSKTKPNESKAQTPEELAREII